MNNENNQNQLYNDYAGIINNYINTVNNSITYLNNANQTINNMYRNFDYYSYYNNFYNTQNQQPPVYHSATGPIFPHYNNLINLNQNPELNQTTNTTNLLNNNTSNLNNEVNYSQISRENLSNQINNNIVKTEYHNINEPLNNTCPITQEDFEPNDEVGYIRHCGHIFKYDALYNWLSQHQTCPTCRYNILTDSNLIGYRNGRNGERYILNNDQFRQLFTNNIINRLLQNDSSNNIFTVAVQS